MIDGQTVDDVQYVVSSRRRSWNQERIEESFQQIIDYLNSNGLEINKSKMTLTEFMSCQKIAKIPGIPPELTVSKRIDGRYEDKLVRDSPICMLLGGNLQNNLGWEGHLVTGEKAILPNIRKKLGMITRLKDNISMKARLHLVNSLVISMLAYLISLWGNTTPNQVRKVQICLNLVSKTGN